MSLIIKLYRKRLNKMPACCYTLTKILNRKFGKKKRNKSDKKGLSPIQWTFALRVNKTITVCPNNKDIFHVSLSHSSTINVSRDLIDSPQEAVTCHF